jgi:hypothetical protein
MLRKSRVRLGLLLLCLSAVFWIMTGFWSLFAARSSFFMEVTNGRLVIGFSRIGRPLPDDWFVRRSHGFGRYWLGGLPHVTSLPRHKAVTIPFWVPCLGLAGLLLYGRFRHKPATWPSCSSCGYNLTGNESEVCPECGEKTSC